MGKRSNFERVERDFYPTPAIAIRPLLRHLPLPNTPNFSFIEPCAGNGKLRDFLMSQGYLCAGASDIEPRGDMIIKADACRDGFSGKGKMFITNPPWERAILHKIIVNLSDQKPTWLLFDADWVHTRQAIPYVGRLQKIVSVGRVKWIEGSPYTGKDNCAWHLFDGSNKSNTIFYGRRLFDGWDDSVDAEQC